jgi:hypothetical protein
MQKISRRVRDPVLHRAELGIVGGLEGLSLETTRLLTGQSALTLMADVVDDLSGQ